LLLNEIPHNNEFKGSLQLVEGKPTITTLFYAAESPKIQTGIINYWYSSMLHVEIYITIYRRILKKFLGNRKLLHFTVFHRGKVIPVISSLFF